MKKNAFTLIELLVVIAIIAILASLAVPVISTALEKGKAVSDASNLKQLGLGMVQYLNDHEDDMFPQSGSGGGDSTWPQSLHKYVADWKAFRSPFDTRANTDVAPYPVSFGFNNNLFGVNTSKFTAPSELLVIAPAKSASGNSKTAFQGTSTGNPTLTPGSGYGTFRKELQLNALFADGHVMAISTTDFKDTSSVKGRARWTPTPTQQQ